MDAVATTTLPPEGALLIKQAMEFPVDVKGVKISTPEESQAAVNQCRDIKALAKQIEEYRKSITDPMRAEIAAIMDTYCPAMEFLTKCEVALKGSITTFDQEQRRIAADLLKEQQRLQQLERARAVLGFFFQQYAADMHTPALDMFNFVFLVRVGGVFA